MSPINNITLPKCKHLLQQRRKPIGIVNTLENTNNVDTIPTGDNKPSEEMGVANIPCHSPALRGHSYCRSHIKLYEEDFQRFLAEQSKNGRASATKYKLVREEMRTAYREKLGTGQKLFDLREDIAVLSILLEQILNEPRILRHELVIKIIDQQRKCISTLNDIRKTSMQMFGQEKMNMMVDKIINILNKHIQDSEVKKAIATDFVAVSKEFGEQEKST